ncbi:hypothetical protein RND81_11G085800 [Saponaria officinalis]|uniref:Secreted protein n=1 Tax=Saponaria officinalis TaxID=3572 RepID=A0AAW1HJM5_SAPOF
MAVSRRNVAMYLAMLLVCSLLIKATHGEEDADSPASGPVPGVIGNIPDVDEDITPETTESIFDGARSEDQPRVMVMGH